MASLGAGAGAFTGDSERSALGEKRRQADMENRRRQEELAQRDREFKMNLGQRQSENAESTRRYDSSVSIANEDKTYQRNRTSELDLLSREDKKYDRNRTSELDALNQEDREYQRGRNDKLDSINQQNTEFAQNRAVRQDEWSEAINGLTQEHKQQEIEQNDLTLAAYRDKVKEDKDNKEKRNSIAKSHFGALLISTAENGGVAPVPALELYKQNTGRSLKGLYFTRDGDAVVDEEGEGGVSSNFVPRDITSAAMEFFSGSPSASSGGRSGSYGTAKSDVSQQKIDMQKGENYLMNLERRIDALKEDLKDYPDQETEKKIKGEIKNLRKRHEDVSNEVYGKYSSDDEKGGDKGGGKVPTFVNPVVEKLYGMSKAELSDRLRRTAKAKNQDPNAVLFGILKGETQENRNAFLKSLK